MTKISGSVPDNSKLQNNLLQLAWAKSTWLAVGLFSTTTLDPSTALPFWLQYSSRKLQPPLQEQQEEHLGIFLSDVVRRAKINKNPKIHYLKWQPLTRPLQIFIYDIADFSFILLAFCVCIYNVKWKKVLEQIVQFSLIQQFAQVCEVVVEFALHSVSKIHTHFFQNYFYFSIKILHRLSLPLEAVLPLRC